ncbi:MAG: NAD(P)-dependent oxidoreductase [Betaproteobacteria bacterium]
MTDALPKVLAVDEQTEAARVLCAHLCETLSDVARVEVLSIERGSGRFVADDDQDAEIREYYGKVEDILPHVEGVVALAVHVAPVPKALIETARDLRFIACARGGPVNVNVMAATTRGIPVIFTPGRNADAVADLTLGLMIAAARHIARADALVRGGVEYWNKDIRATLVGAELGGKTLGLIGFGNVGRKVLARAKGFGLKALVYDPFVSPEQVKAEGAVPTDLSDLLAGSDFVSLHLRESEETFHFMNARRFAAMKPGSYFINTSRGSQVDEQALYDVLVSGHLAGAALDVMAEEPVRANHPLLTLPNVTVTPHIGGQTREISLRGAEMLSEDLRAALTGGRPRRVINPQVFDDGRRA